MKKLIRFIIGLTILSLAFTACGTTPTPQSEPKPAPVVQETPPEKPIEEEKPVPVAEKIPEPVKEPPVEVPVKKYIVAAGDTLSGIALKFYGTREKAYYFPIIMVMNPGKVKHPDKLTPKMVLLIPDYDIFMQHSPSKVKAKPEFEKCIRIYTSEKRYGVIKSLKKRIKEFQ